MQQYLLFLATTATLLTIESPGHSVGLVTQFLKFLFNYLQVQMFLIHDFAIFW